VSEELLFDLPCILGSLVGNCAKELATEKNNKRKKMATFSHLFSINIFEKKAM
jgi:hypothetical protein